MSGQDSLELYPETRSVATATFFHSPQKMAGQKQHVKQIITLLELLREENTGKLTDLLLHSEQVLSISPSTWAIQIMWRHKS